MKICAKDDFKTEELEMANFQAFRDCLSTPLIEKSSVEPTKKTRKSRGKAGRKNAIKPISVTTEESNDAEEELAEFIDYLATEIFANLPPTLRTLTYSTWLNTHPLQTLYTLPLSPKTASNILDSLPAHVTDSLTSYSFLPTNQTTAEFLHPILTTYISTITTPPPPPSLTRNLATECEICGRHWIPLTYHHLIPKAVHAKVLKRGWHTEDRLNDVAWLCRACHSFLHRVASHEELAREWFSVERLMDREDVRAFAGWVGKVRWKSK